MHLAQTNFEINMYFPKLQHLLQFKIKQRNGP